MNTTAFSNEVPKRALALDALRGIAILAMILSSRIPYGSLPGWMYHAQNPPPSHAFNPALPGISWVDLVFPFFLFAMGAAFPFALSKKLDAGIAKWKISLGILQRGLLLALFAIVIQHLRPTVINATPDLPTNMISLIGFVLLFLIYTRYSQSIAKNSVLIIKGIGAAGLGSLLLMLSYADGKGFSVERSDIIILVLSNVAVAGSLIWLFTRNNWLIRLSFLGLLIAIRLSAPIEGNWINWLWNNSPVPWLFKLYYLQYLLIVLPGTIAGDIILSWMNSKDDKNVTCSWDKKKLWIIAFSLIVMLLIIMSGLYSRDVLLVTIAAFVFCVLFYFYLKNADTTEEITIRKLFNWAAYWLMLGLFFEAYEGGIQKGRPTLSFYFVTTGLAIFLLISFFIIIQSLKKQIYLKLLIDNGQNPMLAYAGGTNLLNPFLSILFIDNLLSFLNANPWLGVVKGIITTLMLAYIVKLFTFKKIFWRT